MRLHQQKASKDAVLYVADARRAQCTQRIAHLRGRILELRPLCNQTKREQEAHSSTRNPAEECALGRPELGAARYLMQESHTSQQESAHLGGRSLELPMDDVDRRSARPLLCRCTAAPSCEPSCRRH